jgi:hypothetical protein
MIRRGRNRRRALGSVYAAGGSRRRYRQRLLGGATGDDRIDDAVCLLGREIVPLRRVPGNLAYPLQLRPGERLWQSGVVVVTDTPDQVANKILDRLGGLAPRISTPVQITDTMGRMKWESMFEGNANGFRRAERMLTRAGAVITTSSRLELPTPPRPRTCCPTVVEPNWNQPVDRGRLGCNGSVFGATTVT